MFLCTCHFFTQYSSLPYGCTTQYTQLRSLTWLTVTKNVSFKCGSDCNQSLWLNNNEHCHITAVCSLKRFNLVTSATQRCVLIVWLPLKRLTAMLHITVTAPCGNNYRTFVILHTTQRSVLRTKPPRESSIDLLLQTMYISLYCLMHCKLN